MAKWGRGKQSKSPRTCWGQSATGRAAHPPVEAYDTSRHSAVTVEYKNIGTADLFIDRIIEQANTAFSANRADADPAAAKYDMWSFQGSSFDWGKDDVFKLTRAFTPDHAMGEAVKSGYGGGIPVLRSGP